MKKIFALLSLIAFVFLFTNCKKDLDKDPVIPQDTIPNMKDLVIPEAFNFETAKEVQLTVGGFKSGRADDIKYEVYLYDSQGINISVDSKGDDGSSFTQSGTLVDVMNNLNSVMITDDPNPTFNITVPAYYDTLLVVKNEMGSYSTSYVPITSSNLKADFIDKNLPDKRNFKDDPTDILYGVNSLRELYTVNPLTGELDMVSTLPSNSNGSWACAIDPISEVLYTIGIKYPYYLYAYDLNSGTWETRGATYYSGPRLGYNINDGMLYYSFSYWVLVINPENGQMTSYYKVNGLHDLDGGDLVFSDGGTLYLSSESGLYKCEFTNGNNIQASRISADNLPNYPNSLTFDQNQELWWASNVANNQGSYEGKLFIMDTVTGGFEDRWALPNNYIHDLATLPLDQSQIPQTDTDGDGIIDFYDEYPDDATKAYDTYTPSIYGWGSYAFEDLWPSEGDYDFNDLVLNYRYTHVFNSSDLIVETKLNFNIKNIGGSFRNGFGIELDMNAGLISNVSGYNLQSNIVNLNSKGLESGQSKPVIIVFDDAWKAINTSNELEIIISYASPISEDLFGTKNPFIFVDGDRGREVHLSNMAPTNLVNAAYFGTDDDDSNPAINRYYKNITNLPWAIDIVHDFVYPKERYPIIMGYTKFADWAESGGQSYTDWYKDQDDYRNDQYLTAPDSK